LINEESDNQRGEKKLIREMVELFTEREDKIVKWIVNGNGE
jgi:hypothetical protein